MLDYFSWNGVASSTYGIIVESVNASSRPERKMDIYQVPGRNGDIIFPQDAWYNYERSYTIIAGDSEKNDAPDAYREIASWLYASPGYHILQDTVEGDYFYRAYYKGPLNVEELLSRYGRATVTFSCRPERFLAEGEEVITSSNANITLTNPTGFASKPLIKVTTADSYASLLRLTDRVVIVGKHDATENYSGLSSNLLFIGASYLDDLGQSVINSYSITDDSVTINCKKSKQEQDDSYYVYDGELYAGGGLGFMVAVDEQSEYTIKFNCTDNTAQVCIDYYTAKGEMLDSLQYTNYGVKQLTFWTPERTAMIKVILLPGKTYNSDITFSNIQLQQGDHADTYTRWDGATTGTLKVNGSTVKLGGVHDYVCIDCDTMNAYRESNENRNNYVTIEGGEFPVLVPGTNTIVRTGNFSQIEITPRWWTI